MANTFIEMDSRLAELELAWDKAALICDDIKDGYFSEREPEEWFLKAYYNGSGTKTQILLDYLYSMRESIEALRNLFQQELERKKGKVA